VDILKKKSTFEFTLFNDFKNELEEFKANLDYFNSKTNMTKYYDTLSAIVRDQVEAQTEIIIQKIEKNKELLLKQIDNY
jgi:hypothetical protein